MTKHKPHKQDDSNIGGGADGGPLKDARHIAAERAEKMTHADAEASRGQEDAGKSEHVPRQEFEKLRAELKELEALKDRWLRQAADFENAKKRLSREKEEFVRFAHEGFIRALLPALQNLDRAVHHGQKQNGKADPLVAGVELVIKQIQQIMDVQGVRRVDSVGKLFDPHVHEAVGHMVSDQPEGTILEELEPGFLLHERLIRPAKVVVSQGRESDMQNSDSNPSPAEPTDGRTD